jgi:hypothetical protein
MNKKSQIDLCRSIPGLLKALAVIPLGDLLPLLADRYKWPIAIVATLRSANNPIRAADIIKKAQSSYALDEVTPNYLREIIAVLRRGGVPIKFARSRGYWIDLVVNPPKNIPGSH